jgi:hypothetical protein
MMSIISKIGQICSTLYDNSCDLEETLYNILWSMEYDNE